jgi:hypothetical protein
MSYSILIGEPEIASEPDDGHLRLSVRKVELPNAPAFDGDEMTGRSNARHPSYSGWAEFVGAVGLEEFFFGASRGERSAADHQRMEEKYGRYDGLMAEHPGCRLLRSRDLGPIEDALSRWRKKHPKAKPGFESGQDPILARLLWLEFWVRWALASCTHPSIENY